MKQSVICRKRLPLFRVIFSIISPPKNTLLLSYFSYTTLKNGDRHREHDKTAFISRDIQEWFKNGKYHRECDLPVEIDRNGG